MKTLINLLTTETNDLRIQYFSKTKEWAIKNHTTAKIMVRWNDEEWCNYLGITPESKNNYKNEPVLGFPKGFYNTSRSKDYRNKYNSVQNICGYELHEYITKELKYAQLHYEQSIAKLASRIIKKGLNIENIKVKNNSLGVNINTEITDGVLTVKAWTIIAEGEIQRPHYRYLIK